jgi:hypothetical protein
MPFNVQEIQDKGGIYYGVNAISKNLLICNRKQLLNPHAFWLGVSGSGKSFAAKEEIVSVALSTSDDIILVDPEREYGNLVAALAPLGAQTVNISATSSNYINAMDMAEDYGDGKNPIVLKANLSCPCVNSSWAPDSSPRRISPSLTAALPMSTVSI